VQSDDKRSVRVEMVDVDAFLLHWDAPELIPAPAWLVSARAYVQGNQRADQRLVIDIHKETPPAERKWLLKLALECYLPMRERYLDVIEVFRLSMPGYPLDVLKTTPPPALPEMKRSEFKRSGLDPAPNAASLLPRVIIPSPWRNVYRLLHNISTEEPLWVPNGVLLDFTLTTHNGVKGCITLDRDTAEEAKSATMNTMLLHALRRIIGTSTLPRPDVQRAMGRCNFRRLSFNPSQVSISFVGRYGGILDINLPSPRGGAGIPVWHQPIRVYLIPGGEFSFEYAETSPDWRQDEIQQVVEDHIGVHLEAWSDIQRIIGAFAPTDPRLIKLLTKPAPLKKGYERHSFVPNVTRGAINGVTPHRLKPDSELPRLSRRRRGLYALEYPNMEPAILDCTLAKPQVYIHEQSKHLTMVIAWLFSIVGALFEN
jgi:hypothetical protein